MIATNLGDGDSRDFTNPTKDHLQIRGAGVAGEITDANCTSLKRIFNRRVDLRAPYGPVVSFAMSALDTFTAQAFEFANRLIFFIVYSFFVCLFKSLSQL